MRKKIILTLILVILLLGSTFFLLPINQNHYGVFLGSSNKDLDKISKYDVVVIDGQNFNKEDIDKLHQSACVVYSYLNVGSLENYRDYYDTYKHLSLGVYENWEDEEWIDVSDETWINFMSNELATSLLDKGIDGLFLDNIDVYYNYMTDGIYDGLVNILERLSLLTDKIIINGGDAFISKYINDNGSINSLISGINQECVFTSIDFSNNTLSKADNDTKQYFLDYLDICNKDGLDIYLLEYSNNIFLNKEIANYCMKNNYHYYISENIDLD